MITTTDNFSVSDLETISAPVKGFIPNGVENLVFTSANSFRTSLLNSLELRELVLGSIAKQVVRLGGFDFTHDCVFVSVELEDGEIAEYQVDIESIEIFAVR